MSALGRVGNAMSVLPSALPRLRTSSCSTEAPDILRGASDLHPTGIADTAQVPLASVDRTPTNHARTARFGFENAVTAVRPTSKHAISIRICEGV
jgi:hypothetical protein